MKKILPAICALLFLMVTDTMGQSKRILREMGIASMTVQEYFLEEGMDEPVVESIEKYNEDGELIELQEFNKEGEVKTWERYVYNSDGQLVEEIFLDERGRVEETEKNIYEGELRVEKQFFDNRGRMYKKKVYEYEYRD